ncbi:hypothetical protein [Streptomyces sp. NPDC006333]
MANTDSHTETARRLGRALEAEDGIAQACQVLDRLDGASSSSR